MNPFRPSARLTHAPASDPSDAPATTACCSWSNRAHANRSVHEGCPSTQEPPPPCSPSFLRPRPLAAVSRPPGALLPSPCNSCVMKAAAASAGRVRCALAPAASLPCCPPPYSDSSTTHRPARGCTSPYRQLSASSPAQRAAQALCCAYWHTSPAADAACSAVSQAAAAGPPPPSAGLHASSAARQPQPASAGRKLHARASTCGSLSGCDDNAHACTRPAKSEGRPAAASPSKGRLPSCCSTCVWAEVVAVTTVVGF